MESVIERGTRRRVRFLLLPEVGPHGPVAEYDLCAAGRSALPEAGLCGRTRRRLDRVGGGRVDPGAHLRKPGRSLSPKNSSFAKSGDPDPVLILGRVPRGHPLREASAVTEVMDRMVMTISPNLR